jgi:hypothetical protein
VVNPSEPRDLLFLCLRPFPATARSFFVRAERREMLPGTLSREVASNRNPEILAGAVDGRSSAASASPQATPFPAVQARTVQSIHGVCHTLRRSAHRRSDVPGIPASVAGIPSCENKATSGLSTLPPETDRFVWRCPLYPHGDLFHGQVSQPLARPGITNYPVHTRAWLAGRRTRRSHTETDSQFD